MSLSTQSLNSFTTWVAEYRRNLTRLQQHQERKQSYTHVRKVLADPRLTVYIFDCAVGMLWSSGLLRQKNWWQGAEEELRKLVTYLSSPPSQESVGAIYQRALAPPPQGYKVKGVGPNLVSEILTVYDSQRYGIYNKRPCVVINDLCGTGFPVGFVDGANYQGFVQILIDLQNVGALEDLMEVDTVLNFQYPAIAGS